MYVVLDVESTGGPIDKDAIIEIALFRFDGERILDQLISLVHTDRPIQAYVQKMTGITPNMLRSAPRWHEIAKRVVEITEGAILVGHGVSFDYRMVRQEFARLGYPYERSTIDTVNWSRKLFPGESSYKLTSLCESLGIWLPRNHRAGDDARATLDLFKKLLDKDVEHRIRSLGAKGDAHEKPAERLQQLLREVRDEPGVFYLYDAEGQLMRSGLAERMHGELSRIFLSPEAEDVKVQQAVARLHCEPTGTRLLAQLRLHAERTVQHQIMRGKGSALVWDAAHSRIHLVKGVEPEDHQLAFFRNVSDARKLLRYWQRHFEICPNGKIGRAAINCEAFNEGRTCSDACNASRQKDHNRLLSLLPIFRLEEGTMELRLPGRSSGEKAFVQISDGQAGYLFYKLDKEVEAGERRRRNLTSFPLDAYTRGLLWRQFSRYPKGSLLDLPESVALTKPE